jgi:peptidylprolyl isomerase
MAGRSLALLALIAALLALTLAACGDDDDDSAARDTPTAASEAPKEDIGTDLDVKPVIGKPEGEPPTELVKEDIVTGTGRAAKEGDQVTVHYVGVTFTHGDQFDASWDRGEPATFQLAKGQLIDGWVEGMKGMRVGGRRKLTIPSDLAYGAQGSPPAIPPNEPLVFVIDLKKVSRG